MTKVLLIKSSPGQFRKDRILLPGGHSVQQNKQERLFVLRRKKVRERDGCPLIVFV